MNHKSADRTITATELKNNLGCYLDHVIDGHEVVITKNGKKAVRLSSYATDHGQQLVIEEQTADSRYGGQRVSYEEFMEIYEKSDQRMEFINGEMIVLGSPTPYHQEISGNLYVELRNYLRGKTCKAFFAPFDVHFHKEGFSEPDVMQPDLLVACDLEENIDEHGRYTGTPTLVVEILSPGTRARDMIAKLNTYTLSGVKEYWIVDPSKQLVMVYVLENSDIRDFDSYRMDDTISSQAFDGLDVAVAGIFSS